MNIFRIHAKDNHHELIEKMIRDKFGDKLYHYGEARPNVPMWRTVMFKDNIDLECYIIAEFGAVKVR